MPAATHIRISVGWRTENRNRPRRKGTYKARPRNRTAPPVTHQSAVFGERSVAKTVRDQERFTKISPRLAIMSVA
jgi:hypothetical protein